MNFHIHVLIDGEIERIRKGEGTVLGDCSDIKAWNILQQAKKEGKKYRSGCSNMKKDGSCGGHEN